MCGRYAINQTGRHLAATFGAAWLGEPPPLPRYNVAPWTVAPVLRSRRDGTTVLEGLRWGFVPRWAADSPAPRRMINARAETAARTPAFRDALERRRCLVPASGFYEWHGPARHRLPYWLHPADDGTLTFAGVWDGWRAAEEGSPARTFAILTTDASADVAPLHPRMPVVVPAGAREAWLDHDHPAPMETLLRAPLQPGSLRYHPVSPAVNRTSREGPELIAAVTPEPPLLTLF